MKTKTKCVFSRLSTWPVAKRSMCVRVFGFSHYWHKHNSHGPNVDQIYDSDTQFAAHTDQCLDEPLVPFSHFQCLDFSLIFFLLLLLLRPATTSVLNISNVVGVDVVIVAIGIMPKIIANSAH